MERKIDRFDKYLIVSNLTDNKVTVDLGLSVGTLGKSRKIGRDLSTRVVECILNFYTDINPTWLLAGEGEMLKSHNQHIGDVSGSGNVVLQGGGNQRDITVHGTDTASFIAMMKERDDKINQMLDRIDGRFAKYDEMIDKYERLLVALTEDKLTANSTIDRLLKLLETK